MQNELDLNVTSETNRQATQERDRSREEYRARFAEKLKDPEFRKIEGFPSGTDEAILAGRLAKAAPPIRGISGAFQ